MKTCRNQAIVKISSHCQSKKLLICQAFIPFFSASFAEPKYDKSIKFSTVSLVNSSVTIFVDNLYHDL